MKQRNKMLKPEKWQSNFASDGKIIGFQKALKLIVVGVSSLALIISFKVSVSLVLNVWILILHICWHHVYCCLTVRYYSTLQSVRIKFASKNPLERI